MGQMTKEIIEQLKTNMLVKLDLNDWRCDKKFVKKLIKALQTNTSLTALDLSGNKFSDKTMGCLLSALKHNLNLKELNIAGNKVGILGSKGLQTLLATNTSLEVLNLNSTQLDLTDSVGFLHALQTSCLKKLHLSGNNLGALSARIISAIQLNTSIEYLDMSHNHLKDKGVTNFTLLLQHNNTLKMIKLNENGITLEGYKLLLAGLQANKTIEQITLTGNETLQTLVSHKMVAQFRSTKPGSCRYEFFQNQEQGIHQMQNKQLTLKAFLSTQDTSTKDTLPSLTVSPLKS